MHLVSELKNIYWILIILEQQVIYACAYYSE